jgi:hypothetical protein
MSLPEPTSLSEVIERIAHGDEAYIARRAREESIKARSSTLDDLYRLSQTQPQVHQVLTAVECGDITLQHALITLVLALSKSLDDTSAALERALREDIKPRTRG